MEKAKQKIIATNLSTLNKALLETFNELRMGLVKPKQADSEANLAGKYIKGLAVKADSRKYLGGKGKIEGLDD